MKNISIKHLQLFEDRSDAACRVVVKTGVSMCGMARAWWRPWAAFGRDADRNADCRGGVLDCALKVGRFMIA